MLKFGPILTVASMISYIKGSQVTWCPGLRFSVGACQDLRRLQSPPFRGSYEGRGIVACVRAVSGCNCSCIALGLGVFLSRRCQSRNSLFRLWTSYAFGTGASVVVHGFTTVASHHEHQQI